MESYDPGDTTPRVRCLEAVALTPRAEAGGSGVGYFSAHV
jgi:hypothetical protein